MTTYTVARHHGVPMFIKDGRPVCLPSYCACAPGWKEQWITAHRHFIEHGRTIFWLMPTGGFNGEWGTTPFWTAPGVIHDPPAPMPDDYVGIDQQADLLLDMCPDARFFVRMMDLPPESWCKELPAEMLLGDDGVIRHSASYASERYLDELGRYLQALTRHCESAAWAERVIGYVIYPASEGATPLACEGHLFDQSPVMQQAFRDWLRERYGSDAALQAAWGDATVTLDNAQVPGDADFRRRADRVLYWPEAQQVQRERDYFACQTPLFRRYCDTILTAFRSVAGPHRLCGFDAFKANMAGWMTHPIFTGRKWKEHYGDQFLATGTTGMAELIDMADLSLIATPHDYRCRWVGFGYDPEGIGDSIVLHGKIMFVEEDQRSYANSEKGLFGSIEPGEEEAILYRNLAASLSRGHQTYPMDVCVGYFEDERIQAVLEHRVRIEERFQQMAREEIPCVTMLVDDRAALYTDFSAEYNDLAVIRQRIWGMNHCGVPTRTYLWDDLERDDFPACHRLFLLPNCYLNDARNQRLLHDKLFRNGNVIVFGPGSGITDGSRVSADFASDLTGIRMELYDYEYPRFVTINRWDHPLTAGFGACDSFGDTHRYGPVLVPADPEATSLGTIALDYGKRRPGLVVKAFENYTVVFTTALPMPSRLLRNLARFSGTHVYNDEDDVIYADNRMVALHAVKPGPRIIHLPASCRVTDAITNDAISPSTTKIHTEITSPTTRWYTLHSA